MLYCPLGGIAILIVAGCADSPPRGTRAEGEEAIEALFESDASLTAARANALAA